MKRKSYLIIALLSTLAVVHPAFAESKRVEVYPLTQQYWDTQPGETLGEITAQLMPHNHRLQQKLMADIVNLNPDAFQDGNPDYMRANTRLWLPNNIPQADGKVGNENTQVEGFSWGSIKRPKR
ncbi:MAG: hypothetical protein OQK32_03030 [Gammaproteobacteria bacterium]|nr:hypothetical protein [Gammaproteobacteria bacterium]MCW8923178.1 hypothetical protein [Gammaproteobacteria bacterium]